LILFSLEKCEAKLMTEFHIGSRQQISKVLFSKRCKIQVLTKRGKIVQKNCFLGKNRFGDKKLWAVIDARVMQVFDISAKF
jgi:hypothetical protein